MRKAAIVIGCNYGDEGKGMAAVHAAGDAGENCLNVLINGGAQRGHTVEEPGGRRHVFHHFGSAAWKGATSCADEDFIVNPLLYCHEKNLLSENLGLHPRLLVAAGCRVSTPWDMMLGQIIEENRGNGRHGSCGCGIQETRLRYLNTPWALSFEEVSHLSFSGFEDYCRRIIREYIPARMDELHMAVPPQWRSILSASGLMENAWLDLMEMRRTTETYKDWAAMASAWPTIVFEAGQGLALDENNHRDFPHLTPSSTTSLASARRIAALSGETDTTLLYVTRSYLTRHGAGPFPTECPKESINPHMEDRTNVPNPHQQSLRYGLFDAQAVLERTSADTMRSRQVIPALHTTILITHLNETAGQLTGSMPLGDFVRHFDQALYSYDPYGVTGRLDGTVPDL
ncbi:MAG: adenylosuccinate synthetase [Clostridiales bacterium]|nr:adenylosuccinate synthetase [Clostridiales bacterium]